MKNKNTLYRLFEFAKSCKGLLLSSVVFAVLKSAIEEAEENFSKKGINNCRFFHSSASNLSFEDESIDVILTEAMFIERERLLSRILLSANAESGNTRDRKTHV